MKIFYKQELALVSTHYKATEEMDVVEYIVDELDEDNKFSSIGVIKEDDSKSSEISNIPKHKSDKGSSSAKRERRIRIPSD
jgi:hypothetical protein